MSSPLTVSQVSPPHPQLGEVRFTNPYRRLHLTFHSNGRLSSFFDHAGLSGTVALSIEHPWHEQVKHTIDPSRYQVNRYGSGQPADTIRYIEAALADPRVAANPTLVLGLNQALTEIRRAL